jgi:hypothetical protein
MQSQRSGPPCVQRARTSRRRALPAIALAGVLIAGALIRLDVAYHAVPFGDDYGTAALMSKHIAEGREFPLYFYGYAYVGAVGAYVGALVFTLFGQSLFSMCLAMLPFSLTWIAATYLLFRRLIGPWAGVIAAALVACAPPIIITYSTAPLIGYPPTFAFGTLLLYLGVRLNDDDLTPRAEWLCLMAMAALASLAIWTHPLSLPYLVVAFGLLIVRVVRARFSPALIAKLGVACVLLVVAALPLLITAHRHGLHAMFGHWPAGFQHVPGNCALMVTAYVPRQLFPAERVPAPVTWFIGLVYAAMGLTFLAGLVGALAHRHQRALRAAVVPFAFVVVFLVLFLANSTSRWCASRYFTPFYLGAVACVAFPLAYRRPWLTTAAAVLAAILVTHNVADTLAETHGRQHRFVANNRAAMARLVDAARDAGLKHVMVPNYHGQALTFVAREQVVFARTTKERYRPYTVRAAADDRAGFAKPTESAHVFAQTLEALGVSSWATFSAGGWTVFHAIELPDQPLALVEPVAASFVDPDGAATDAAALIDQNDATIAGGRFESGRALIVDFGTPVVLTAARFVAPRREDYPVGYTLSGSRDSREWVDIQHVEQRDAATCITGNRLDHEGRFTAMECRFEPTALRYLQISDVRPASPTFEIWQFRQAYFYSPADEGAGASEPTLASARHPAGCAWPSKGEATAIARELERIGVDLVIADEWLSRTIELMPGPHPDVLPRWEFRFPESHVSRVVPIRQGAAVVVETAHAGQAAALVRDATLGDVALAKHGFPHYTAYVVDNAPAAYETFPGLRWNGFTLTGTARIATADWYHRHGERLEHAGCPDEASRYVRRAFETFPGIRANLKRLAPSDDDARGTLDALTPEAPARIRFPHGASLVGYTLVPSPLVAGRPATLRLVWELEGTVKHGLMRVFVHFVVNGQRVFQADHNAIFPVAPGSTVPRALILDEHRFLVPESAPAGAVEIRLGATALSNRALRLKPRTRLSTHSRAVTIGRAEITR